MILLYEVPRIVKLIETEENGSCRGLGEGDGQLQFKEYRVSVLQDRKSSLDGRC